ncbi:MAG: hypothetical protein KA604_01920 [Candidatus Saccharimonas sp.]|nr:hypothetical protein [Candidatus Saccharimonas sp.]
MRAIFWRGGIVLILVAIVLSVYACTTHTTEVATVTYASPTTETYLPVDDNLSGGMQPRPSISTTPSVSKFSDPRGKPVSITILRGKEAIVPQAVFDGGTTQYRDQRGKLVWSPRENKVEWYQARQWPKPGMMSTKTSLILGHVTDVFENLSTAIPGDLAVVSYDSGDTVYILIDWTQVMDKPVATNDSRLWGYNKNPGWHTVIYTCDDRNGFRSDGHRKDNFAAGGHRVK